MPSVKGGSVKLFEGWDWWPAISANTQPDTYTTCASTEDASDTPCLTLDQFNYFCRLAKKDKKLAAIGREVLDGVDIQLPF